MVAETSLAKQLFSFGGALADYPLVSALSMGAISFHKCPRTYKLYPILGVCSSVGHKHRLTIFLAA